MLICEEYINHSFQGTFIDFNNFPDSMGSLQKTNKDPFSRFTWKDTIKLLEIKGYQIQGQNSGSWFSMQRIGKLNHYILIR
jgi:predicted flavoprotein YhiN